MLRREAEECWRRHREQRPVGKRLDAARKRKQRAEQELAKAAQRVRDQLLRYDKAEAEAKEAAAEFAACQSEAQEQGEDPAGQPDAENVVVLTSAAAAMVDWLESHGACFAVSPPEELLQRVSACRQAISVVQVAGAGLDEGDVQDDPRRDDAQEEGDAGMEETD